MVTEDDVRQIIASLPETSELLSAGVPYFRVSRRGFAKLRQEEKAVMVHTAGLPEKDALMRAAPDKFFSTPHYDGHPAVLVRLSAVDTDELTELLVASWRLRAPDELRDGFDQEIELGGSPRWGDAMQNGKIRPYALKPGEGWTYNFGVDFVVKVGELGQGRRLAVVEYTTRAGEEPPDHTHGTEDEMFYVLSGDVAFRCGEDTFDLEAGGFVFLPRGIEHGYQIKSSGEVHLLVLTAPAPENGKAGWGGFVADFEEEGELRASPPGLG